eukprot:948324-Pelagomonas_calceolata.AAC.3
MGQTDPILNSTIHFMWHVHAGTLYAGDDGQDDGFGVDGGCDDGGGFDGGFEDDDYGTCEGSEGMGAVLGSGGAPDQVWDFEHQSYQQVRAYKTLQLSTPRARDGSYMFGVHICTAKFAIKVHPLNQILAAMNTYECCKF